MDEWDKLRFGHTEEAVGQMRARYNERPKNLSLATQLGIAYFWQREWRAAWEHFCAFNELYPYTVDSTIGLAGTAKWCDGQPEAAVTKWNEGRECEYADLAGGVTIPLLLFFAAAVQPDLMPLDEAIELLQTRVEKKRADMWPAPLASLVLGHLDKAKANEAAVSTRPDGTTMHKWKIGFWNGVAQCAAGNVEGFQQAMRSTSSLAWDDFDKNKSLFIDKLWGPEFFLARCEAERNAPPT